MGLLGKIGGWIKGKVNQGIQGSKNFAGKAWEKTKNVASGVKDFVVNNADAIGGIVKAATPLISAYNPALGMLANTGADLLSKLKPGPVKDKLKKLSETNDSSEPSSTVGKRKYTQNQKQVTVESGAQQALNRKRAKLMTQT